MELPPEFKETIISVHGSTGKSWLLNLDGLIDYCENKWRFKLMEYYKLSFNFVAPVVFEDDSKAVLKLGVPSAGINNEAMALKVYNGNGSCKLLNEDTKRGILLLEYLHPGKPLNIITNNAEATKIAADLVKAMKCNVPHFSFPFPSIQDQAKSLHRMREQFNGGTGPIPEEFVIQAEAFFKYLSTTMHNVYLLHGDLHHENILSVGDTWKAIDPKGIIGETGYELIPFLMNDLNGRDVLKTVTERINIFSERLNLDRDRIVKWAVYRSVLSLCWKIEDNMPVTSDDLEITEVFYKMSVGL